jgi:hypothetical protein
MLQFTKEQIQNQFRVAVELQSTTRYKKFRRVDARRADNGEIIITFIRGEVETTNVANDNGVVVMNMTTKSREQYIIPSDKFAARYLSGDSVTEDWTTFEPIGEVDAVEWDGVSTEFEAPWGELMVIHAGDFLCGVPGSPEDVYRIARDEFFETYKIK